MPRPRIDLARTLERREAHGGTPDFPVTMRPVYYRENGTFEEVPKRRAVVREDTGATLAVVSDRYTLVRHTRILDAVDDALHALDLGAVPRGLYLDRRGARMRALYKFSALRQPVDGGDTICPCLKIRNSYDATSRIALQIGAFRFVCTNLAVGGGGIFSGGFMAVHQGEIPVEDVTRQLTEYLANFDSVVELYRRWTHCRLEPDPWHVILETLPKRPARVIAEKVARWWRPTVYDAYNAATYHATHRMRSTSGAFGLLKRVNRSFQERFPPADGEADPNQMGLTLSESVSASGNGR